MLKNQSLILKEYYSKRAQEYDQIYTRSDKARLKEQKIIAQKIKQVFKNRNVLEVACGTGFWTSYLSRTATNVLATDINLEMLEIASSRNPSKNTQFIKCDAYNLPITRPKFSGAMANFWFSHIPKNRTKLFLENLHKRLSPGASVLITDSVYRKELGGELVKKGNIQDTFKRRTLSSGKKFDILKNYYSKQELKEIFSVFGKKLEIYYMVNFWMACYQI